jgi:hypothetical protein
MLAGAREEARSAQCASNLSRAGFGFSLYGADHRGALPRTEAGFRGGTWWDVGRADRSHSANLFLLVRGGYASLADLSCPGNHAAPTADAHPHALDWSSPEEVSFSYQLPSRGATSWTMGSRRVLLADRSPVVVRARRGEVPDPLASSPNHGGAGQNILFGDASIRFQALPTLPSGDNIWLPGRAEGPPRRLTGREAPFTSDDAFVGP